MNQENGILIRVNCTIEYRNSCAWRDRAVALSESGRFVEALQAYDYFLELYPDD